MSITVERWNSILSDYPGIQPALFEQRRRVCDLLKENHLASISDCETINLRPFDYNLYSVQKIRVVTKYSRILDKPIGFRLNKLLEVNGAEIEVGNFFELDNQMSYWIYIPSDILTLGACINGSITAFIRSKVIGLYISYEVVIYDLSS